MDNQQHEQQMSVFDRILKALVAINNSVIGSTKQQMETNAKLDIVIARLDTLIEQQSGEVLTLSGSVDPPVSQ